MGIRRRGFGLSILYLTVGALSAQMNNETTRLTVHVLDSKSSKPVQFNHILVFAGATPEEVRFHKRSFEARTDASGSASMTVDLKTSKYAQIFVDGHSLCEKSPNLESFSLEEAHKQGLQLNHCSATASEAMPDQLIVYLRPETFWEGMEH